MANCCLQCFKCLFCFLNVLLFLLGAAMFSIGLWVLISKTAYVSVLQAAFDSFQTLLYIFIVVGAFAMLLALWGILGFYFGVKFVLIIYIPLLIVIVFFHLFPGLFFKQKEKEDVLAQKILSLIKNYNPTDQTNQHKEMLWDSVQIKLSCCGWTGPENWKNSTFFQDRIGIYPCSCSHNLTSFQPALGICRLEIIYRTFDVDDWPVKQQGCGALLRKWFKKLSDTVFLTSFIVIAFGIVGIGLSFYICTARHTNTEGVR